MFLKLKFLLLTFLLIQNCSATQINVINEIKMLRINDGIYAGGYVLDRNCFRLNWYFNNHGLLPIVQSLSSMDLDFYIRKYLDLYINKLNADFTIDDVNFAGCNNFGTFTKQRSDSDDSYAATFLSLSARYVRASANWNWWTANLATMKNIAYWILARSLKSNSLTSVFKGTANIGYLMDNSEVYRGFRDFAALLRDRGDPDGTYYDHLAFSNSAGICNLFNSAGGGFSPSDDIYSWPTNSNFRFYPEATCQIFPQAFGVSECSGRFNASWILMNQKYPNWDVYPLKYEEFPWALIGFVAAKRGDFGRAQTQLASIEQLFVADRNKVTINELGFYQRTKNLLAGFQDV